MKKINGVTYYGLTDGPLAPIEAATCPAVAPGDEHFPYSYYCTRTAGHSGTHKAQVRGRHVAAEWS